MPAIKLADFREALSEHEQQMLRAKAYVAKVPGDNEPGRNDAAYILSARLREKFNLEVDDRIAIMTSWAQSCTPPLDKDELARVVRNPDRYAQNAAGSKCEPMRSKPPKDRTNTAPGRMIKRRCFADIEPRSPEYIIPEIVVKGVIVSCISQEGIGKSTLASYLASVISNGMDWPTSMGEKTERGDVVIFSHEEDEGMMALRLVANGADMDRVHLGESVISPDGGEDCLDIEFDMDILEDWADELPELRLIIFDPITSYTTANENSNSEVRKALKPLVDFAARRGITILMLSHLSKKVDLGMINRTIGSRAWSAVPRLIWGIQEEQNVDDEGNKTDTGNRFLLCVKCNLGPKPKGMRFSIGDGGRVMFDTQRFDKDVDSAGIQASRGDEIGQWLIDRIGRDTLPQKEIAAEAKKKWGISSRRLGQIATEHGIKKRYSVAESRWVWSVKC